MPPSQDSQSQSRRPVMLARQASSSSQVSQSPSELQSTSHRATHKQHQRHVVGHGTRIGPRNTSFGKNLNKLNKLTAATAQGGDAGPTAATTTAAAPTAGATTTISNTKHHRRSQSGTSTEPSSSPRPGVKRNASAAAITRNTSHTALRKNHSSGHLPRQASSKNMHRSGGPIKTALVHRSKRSSPETNPHPSVHFDVGDDEDGQEDQWTEESTSQSPNTTRSHTRQNSVILDHEKPTNPASDDGVEETSDQSEAGHGYAAQENDRDDESEDTEEDHDSGGGVMDAPSSSFRRPEEDITSHPTTSKPPTSTNPAHGRGSYQHSRPPDADLLTSRLLQRSTSHNLAPQMSAVSAMVVSHSQDPRSLSHSQGSTLAETPGRELVSRFIDGRGSSSGGQVNRFFPDGSPPPADKGHSENDAIKRNKSLPNLNPRGQTRSVQNDDATTSAAELPENRTQQKLSLMRAASNMEPQKKIPAVIPRSSNSQFFSTGVNFTVTAEGRTDPRMQRQIDQAAIEYDVVRRYRNPIAEALMRLEKGKKKTFGTSHTSKSSISLRSDITQGNGSSKHGSPSQPRSDAATQHGHSRTPSRLSRPHSRERADVEGTQSFESDYGRLGTGASAAEICRRMWDMQINMETE